MKTQFLLLLSLITALLSAKDFTTEGNGIRYVVNAKVENKDVLYISELDGAIACYSLAGDKIWEQATQKVAVLFKIVAADVDGDKNDDILAASADGHIYCWSSKGELLWKYAPENKVRFSEVAVIHADEGLQIFAGGNDYTLYELDAKGQEVSKTKLKGVFRSIQSGNFVHKDTESLFVMTYAHDKFRWAFMGYINPKTKAIEKELAYKKAPSKIWSSLMVTDLDVADVNKDGLDDILFFGTGKSPAMVIAMDKDFEVLFNFESNKKEKQRYAHVQGKSLQPVKDQIMFQNGGLIQVIDLQGKLIEKTGERYKANIYNDFTLITDTRELIAGGQIGGGNSLYFFDLEKASWPHSEFNIKGRLAEVDENINTLYKQVLNFTPPSYQPKPDKKWEMITPYTPSKKVMALKGAELNIISQETFQESTNRDEITKAIGPDALRKDKRGKYNMTRAEIVQVAKDFEKRNEPFTYWAGHGNDPFYLQIETLEEVLRVAPNTCYGFIYAEMFDPEDPRVVFWIKEYLPRLAKAMRKNGKAKIYMRYKNVFWAASSYQSPWKEMLFGGKYADILVPASEDTSSRTQDINLSGRVGMYTGGFVNDFAMRLVDDNPTSWRPLTPGGQKSISPYLRQGVMMAAYGARYGIIFNNNYTTDPGLDVLFALMTSGALPQVTTENVMSISSWHLIQDVDQHLIEKIDDHHNMLQYTTDDEDAVFSVAQMHWAGTDVPEWDYSKAALGVEYRWLNYMPILPNGMVPVAPVEYASSLKVPYTISDTKQGFVDGKPVPAKEFGQSIKAAAIKGSKKMPIVIEGAAWSTIRLDEKHIRIIALDPSYIAPEAREITITFQNETPLSARDILSNEKVMINNNVAKVIVPAGSLRLIDVAY